MQAALASGSDGEHADIVIQSTHKMLGAFTQASMLHIKGRRALRLPDTISRALQILQVDFVVAFWGTFHAHGWC